jgi:hypothetical protein
MIKKLKYIIDSRKNRCYHSTHIAFMVIEKLKFSYQERWRDWPDEARQPQFFQNWKVPIPAGAILGDKKRNMKKSLFYSGRGFSFAKKLHAMTRRNVQ